MTAAREASPKDVSGAPGADARLASTYREEASRLTATMIRMLGDFDLAEEIVAETFAVALEHWRRAGVPDRPGAWLETVARRRALDRLRRNRRYREKLATLERVQQTAGGASVHPAERGEPDDRLRLIFTCCHPALALEARVALTLRTICGLSYAEIAANLLTTEAAVAQRVSRARRKIAGAGIPYRVPTVTELPERLSGVLAVLYLLFNEGYISALPGAASRRDISEDAAWLCALLVELLPDEPEPIGLLALMRLHLARSAARFDEQGNLVLLREQDRSRWDARAIGGAIALIERAGAMHRPGPYQLEAAIAACHAEAPTWAETDWRQILVLYDMLLGMKRSPVVRLNRAVALWQVGGPDVALAEVESLQGALDGYHLYHSVRGLLLSELGRREQAHAADLRALALTGNRAERLLLERRLISEPAPTF